MDQAKSLLVVDELAALRIGDIKLALLDQLPCNSRREFDAAQSENLEEAPIWHQAGLRLIQHAEKILDLRLQPVAQLRQKDLTANGLVL